MAAKKKKKKTKSIQKIWRAPSAAELSKDEKIDYLKHALKEIDSTVQGSWVSHNDIHCIYLDITKQLDLIRSLIYEDE